MADSITLNPIAQERASALVARLAKLHAEVRQAEVELAFTLSVATGVEVLGKEHYTYNPDAGTVTRTEAPEAPLLGFATIVD